MTVMLQTATWVGVLVVSALLGFGFLVTGPHEGAECDGCHVSAGSYPEGCGLTFHPNHQLCQREDDGWYSHNIKPYGGYMGADVYAQSLLGYTEKLKGYISTFSAAMWSCVGALCDWKTLKRVTWSTGAMLVKNVAVVMTTAWAVLRGGHEVYMKGLLDVTMALHVMGRDLVTHVPWFYLISGGLPIVIVSVLVKKVLEKVYPSELGPPCPTAMARAIGGEEYMPIKSLGTSSDFQTFVFLTKATQRKVFVRYLKRGASKRARAQVAREYRILDKLRHPNIISVIGFQRIGDAISLLLEFATHGSLVEALSRYMHTKLVCVTLTNKLLVFRQVVEAVKYLHISRIAHLNIRPEAALVFREWSSVKLSAFGRAANVPQRGVCHRFNLHVDCAPASVVVDKEPYDPYKVDIWALSALLLFILTGARYDPFGPSPIPKLLTAVEGCSDKQQAAVVSLVRRMFSTKAQDRPDAGDVLKALDDVGSMQIP